MTLMAEEAQGRRWGWPNPQLHFSCNTCPQTKRVEVSLSMYILTSSFFVKV